MAIPAQNLGKRIFLAIVVIAIAVLGYLAGTKKVGEGSQAPYQAVFLSNGQVYFGKIVKRTAALTTLKDVYYLQVQQPIQPAPEGKQSEQPQVQLVKLGGELHKPKDEMVINNDHILFIEEIQNDGQVGQTIERHKRGETDNQSQSQTTPQQ